MTEHTISSELNSTGAGATGSAAVIDGTAILSARPAAMTVHIVHARNAHLYDAELEQFFRLRHDIYVDEKKWRDASPDGMERDQFDSPDATYCIGMCGGEVVAGSRLIPTDLPHLLSEVFPHACDFAGVPRNARMAEWTRGFIVKSARDALGLKVKAASCAAIMEYCVSEGITQVGGIQEMYWLPLWKRLGWTVNYVGSPLEIDNTWCVAAYFDVSRAAMMNARAKAGLEGSNLVHAAPRRPFHPFAAPGSEQNPFADLSGPSDPQSAVFRKARAG